MSQVTTGQDPNPPQQRRPHPDTEPDARSAPPTPWPNGGNRSRL